IPAVSSTAAIACRGIPFAIFMRHNRSSEMAATARPSRKMAAVEGLLSIKPNMIITSSLGWDADNPDWTQMNADEPDGPDFVGAGLKPASTTGEKTIRKIRKNLRHLRSILYLRPIFLPVASPAIALRNRHETTMQGSITIDGRGGRRGARHLTHADID